MSCTYEYRSIERASKKFNSFFKIINITVDSTLVPWSVTQLRYLRFDTCTIFDWMLAQPSNQHLSNRRINALATVETLSQLPIRRMCNEIDTSETDDSTLAQLSNG